MKTKERKGISLIVLVITIIVIVILASAVILNLTKNNPMDNAKIAKLLQEKENMDSAMQMYITKVMMNTLGEYSTKEILTGGVTGYSSLVSGDELTSESLTLRQANDEKIKEALDISLPKTSNKENIKWYINLTDGNFYLVHETAQDYAKYLGNYYSETEILENTTLSRFVMTKKSMTIIEKPKELVADGSFNGKVNTPVLMEGMTPIYFDASGNEVVITAENQENWYNYEANIWANAKTKDGSYWVWIPRYEYKVIDQTIDVKFIPTSKTTPDAGYTYVHPAFRDGSATHFMNGEWDNEIPGFWVAKYAAGFQASTTSAQDATGVINASDSVVYSDKNYTSYNESYGTNALSQNLSQLPKMSYPVFKPLTYAYNNISTGDVYTLSREIAKASSFYGLNSSRIDSHMMKNSEWGAVAYLTESKYGRNGEEITINSKSLNNLNEKQIYAVTGYENDLAGGLGASSTKNKSGIFDLSGCVWERTTGYISDGDMYVKTYGSSYVNIDTNENGYQTLSTKYVTVYPYNITDNSGVNNWAKYSELKSTIYGYGDAILETSISGTDATSWNDTKSSFPYFDAPFFLRGGTFFSESNAGKFAFNGTAGDSNFYDGFRAVLIGK